MSQAVGVGFHADATVADTEIGGHPQATSARQIDWQSLLSARPD